MKSRAKRERKDQTGFGALDYLLMTVGNCFAVYSAGMAVGARDSGNLFVGLIVIGSFASYCSRFLLRDSRFLGLDAFLYAGATICAVLFNASLNQLLPGDGIPADVMTAGWLCWMLSMGSFFTWRDRTLLFQAVPTIALFGLIGCYDTFAPAPFLFFGFLLCLATLLGRSHSRDMLRQAVLSGYFNRSDSPMSVAAHPEQSPELYADIKRGPWRWLAGPEWALASGLVIVVMSVLGAPVIRQAVQPISGAIKILSPRRNRNTFSSNRLTQQSSDYEVGRGPLNQGSTPHPLYVVSPNTVRYLRESTFDRYTGRGWTSSIRPDQPRSWAGLGESAVDQMSRKQPFEMEIAPVAAVPTIPLPAETQRISPSVHLNSGGSAVALQQPGIKYRVEAVDSKANPVSASIALPEDIERNCTDVSNIHPDVANFAKQAAENAGSDYDKAMAIQEAIGNRCKYSKLASPVPPDRDAADFFLNTSRVGYCDLFATAMVESARAVGIPAHFCIGYLPNPADSPSQGELTVTDQDYHAWAELYFKDVGWVVFDATAEAQTLDPNLARNQTVGAIGVLTNILDVLIVIGALLALTLFLIPRIRRKSVRKAPPGRGDARKIYLSFSKALSRAVKERRGLSETPTEYLVRLRPYLNGSAAEATRLNERLETAMFGPSEPTPEALKELQSEVKAFKKTLAREATKFPASNRVVSRP